MVDSAQLLRAKAMLLIRREREVHELRVERSRVEVWLNVFNRLSLNLLGTATAPLFEQWIQAMVGELAFQVATVHACDEPTERLRLLVGVGHVPIALEVPWSHAERSYLAANPSGLYSDEKPEALGSLADVMQLGRFYWLLVSMCNQPFLLTAGFAQGSEHFHATNPHDFDHFVLLGSHVAALVSNATLIGELDREKSELQESNNQLDINLRRLRETQHELVASGKRLAEASRRAGMADIATGVLHNVGNALNSVNVSAEILNASLRGLEVSGVSRVAALIERNSADWAGFFADARRGGSLPAYLGELGAHLARERDSLITEVTSLQEHVDHIKAIVSKQQTYATSFDASQPCVAKELIDDALFLTGQSLSEHGILITRDYEPVQEIVVDRHKVLQILVNLLKNAQDALLSSPQSDKRIVAQLTAVGNGNMRFAIHDNGVGIAPEQLARLFAFGFTTKEGGHGFGLHASAIAADELGGSISANSEGQGRGATFTLELPPRPKIDPDLDP